MSSSVFMWLQNRWWVILFAAGVVFALLAFILSIGQSVWFDEGYSILLAKQPVSELLALTAVDAHPPFYYLVLKAWSGLFGFGEPALRIMSIIFATSAALVSLALTKKLFGVKVALISIPFMLAAPFVLRYAYEIRMYALVALIGVVATYVLIKAREDKKPWLWAMYAGLVALGMYTLYMSVAIWLTHVVWLTWLSIKEKKPIMSWRWPLAYIGAVLIFSPYLMTFLSQIKNSALPGMGHAVTLTSLVDLTTLFALYTPQWSMGGWISLALFFLLLILAPMLAKAKKQVGANQSKYLTLYLLLAFLPILIFALMSLPPREPIFIPRYMAHVAIWVYLSLGVLVAFVLSKQKTKKNLIISSLTLILLVGGVFVLSWRGNFVLERLQKPESRQVAEYIKAKTSCTENSVIVMNDPYTYIDSIYYLDGCDVRFYAKDNVDFAGGYAMLHGSEKRVGETGQITDHKVTIVYYNQPNFQLGNEYKLVAEQKFDQQNVLVFERSN